MTQPVLQYRIPLPFEAAERSLRQALQEEGFGILTEVDVAAVLKAKLDVDTPPQKLLGACNPKLAHSSLDIEPKVGAFLPCGVAIRQGTSEGETIAAMQNPELLAGLFANPALEAPSHEAAERLAKALQSVGTPI